MIKLNGVSKIYNQNRPNEFVALRDIDLSIAADGFTVFMGPSGSGKTTLLSLIGCIARPTTGRIRLNGRETTSLPERFGAEIRRETFGFIFQNYHLIRGLSVLENTMIPAYPTGRKYRDIREKAMQLLEQLDIGRKARQSVELLSGGEQQRTAIARALINEPAIIIADEPTAHLDTERARGLMKILAGFKEKGKVVLIASHDPRIYESGLVNHIVSMRDGRIVESQRKGGK